MSSDFEGLSKIAVLKAISEAESKETGKRGSKSIAKTPQAIFLSDAMETEDLK